MEGKKNRNRKRRRRRRKGKKRRGVGEESAAERDDIPPDTNRLPSHTHRFPLLLLFNLKKEERVRCIAEKPSQCSSYQIIRAPSTCFALLSFPPSAKKMIRNLFH